MARADNLGGAARTWLTALLLAACGSAVDAPDATAGDAGAVGATADASAAQPGAMDGGQRLGDAATEDAGGEARDGSSESSRCVVGTATIRCERRSRYFLTGFTGLVPREVHWQVPLGDPPADGWPVAILFQGSLASAETFWTVPNTTLAGARYQALLVKALLDGGFAVVTPEAHGGGLTAWETNVPPMSLDWELASDHRLMRDLFEAIDDGVLGPLDPGRTYAAGISSGGYMTSRMDLEYRSRFRALAIHSASYATCAGPICAVPDDLDPAHRPTLFLHGEADAIVPVATMERYRDALDLIGVETETVLDREAAHAWLAAAPEAILAWFRAHP